MIYTYCVTCNGMAGEWIQMQGNGSKWSFTPRKTSFNLMYIKDMQWNMSVSRKYRLRAILNEYIKLDLYIECYWRFGKYFTMKIT